MAQSLLQFHQWHISDSVTMSAYRDGIARSVRTGDVVLDLGAGTGILSLMACEAGARRVYAVEPAAIIALVPKIAADNGFGDRVICEKRESFDVELPEKADVMIASMLDAAGVFGTNMLRVVLDARRRLLKPGGVIVPQTVTTSFCPVDFGSWHEASIACWTEPRMGFDFRSVRSVAANQQGSRGVKKDNLLAQPQAFDPIELADATSTNMGRTLYFEIEREGTLHALAGWLDIIMAADVRCSSSPLVETPMSWSHLILPVDSPVHVRSGDRIEAAVRAWDDGRETVVVWDVWLRDALGNARAEFHHSSFYGLLLTKEDLRRLDVDSVRALSERGMAQCTALTLCDGNRSLEEIAAATLESHPGLFRNLADARDFVLGVLREPETAAEVRGRAPIGS
jgi:SAM-dependent methyltransferase